MTIDYLEVVIKLTERCNINCTYCYMFNRGNEDYKSRTPFMTTETAAAIARFLSDGIRDLSTKRVSIVFHGGEPMLMKKRQFDEICSMLRSAVPPSVSLVLGVQTNATLVDEDWIDLLSRHQIAVGVSLDGPPGYHDLHRVDHRGRGTYDRTARGIRLLQSAVAVGRIAPIGAITVVNPEYEGDVVYKHLVHDLGFRNVSLNLPMETYETVDYAAVSRLGKFLTDAFDAWTTDDDPHVHIRIFSDVLRFFNSEPASAPDAPLSHALVVIAGDGELSEDDPFKVINFAQRGGNVRTTSCAAFIDSPLLRYVSEIPHAIPKECRDCCWQNYCRGGAQQALAVTRYRAGSGFSNKSVLCSALKEIYAHITAYLVQHGVPLKKIEAALDYTTTSARTHRDLKQIPKEFFSGGRPAITVRPQRTSSQ